MTATDTTLYDLFQHRVDAAPDATAIVFDDEWTSYGELADEVRRVARGLSALGVGIGDGVLMFAGNSPAVLATYLAVARIGAVFAPVNASFREREGRYVLGNAAPRVAVVEAELLEEFARWGPADDVALVVLGDTDASTARGATSFDGLGRGQADVPPARVPETAPLLLCFTSGTTSTPKPVLHSHRSEIYNARTYAAVWQLGPEDRGVVALPVTWVYGLSTTSMALLTSGGTVLLADRFHPVLVLDVVEAQRATALWGTMTMYSKLLEVLRDRPVDLRSLRVVVNGGEPCPPPLVRAFEELAGVPLLAAYATSEARPVLAARPGTRDTPEGSVGRLVPGAEILLEGADGDEVPVGEPGHALVRCAGMLTEYHREPELTAERITSDGWFRTGDILRRDAAGDYFVVGRESEMIIRSGVNIAPAEVESALLALPAVADAAVVGVPDPRSGEAVRAYVVAVDPASATEDELRDAVGRQLAAYKIPREIIFVDALPTTATGKLDRNALRREATV